jgi:uncharacterized protein (TIGR00369 family)
MKNERLAMLESFIGKHFEKSPSPFARWLNGRVVAANINSVEFEFIVRHDMTNPFGMIHGGVIAGMIDDCIGVNFMILGLEFFYPTINLNIEFFGSAREGETIKVKTEVVKQGNTIINIRAEIVNSENRKLAFATSNLAVSKIKI